MSDGGSIRSPAAGKGRWGKILSWILLLALAGLVASVSTLATVVVLGNLSDLWSSRAASSYDTALPVLAALSVGCALAWYCVRGRSSRWGRLWFIGLAATSAIGLATGWLVYGKVEHHKGFPGRLEAAVVELIKTRSRDTIRIESVASFPWDSLSVFLSYSSAENIKTCLGFDWAGAERLASQLSGDGAGRVLFVRAENVVGEYSVSREKIDFAMQHCRLEPASAIFDVELSKAFGGGLAGMRGTLRQRQQ